MVDFEAAILAINKRILDERNNMKGPLSFSHELKALVVDLVDKFPNQKISEKQLRLSSATLHKWTRAKIKPLILPPRKLSIRPVAEADFISPKKTHHQSFEAVLNNGIVLKGLQFNADCLKMLGAL